MRKSKREKIKFMQKIKQDVSHDLIRGVKKSEKESDKK